MLDRIAHKLHNAFSPEELAYITLHVTPSENAVSILLDGNILHQGTPEEAIAYLRERKAVETPVIPTVDEVPDVDDSE